MLVRSVNRDWRKFSLLTMLSLFLHLLVLGAIGLIVIADPRLMEEFVTTIVGGEELADPITEDSLLAVEGRLEVARDELLPPAETSDLQIDAKGPEIDVKGPFTLRESRFVPHVEQTARGATPINPGTSSERPGGETFTVEVETSGRMSATAKSLLIKQFGGNEASEAAVASGLNWLSAHQLRNGSWSFNHSKHPDCKGKCSQDGSLRSCPYGATAMALLSFLGAGHTHLSGDYRQQVSRAIEFLEKSANQSRTSKGLDYRGPNDPPFPQIYAQALCAIALCECFAMTNDARLRPLAQGAVDLIVNSQNPADGGWRYRRGQPGDTSVVGFQMMALKSAANAGIDVPSNAFKGVAFFLDLAQVERGTKYVYVPGRQERPSDSMTAVGLLCRMYLGGSVRNPQVEVGVKYLDGVRPQLNNMYFNYYATQVMHHWGGEEWTRWNEVMRDQLVRTQRPARSGHFAGSWDVADAHGDEGGRHYMTCLAIMTLEVYYRHLPLYDRDKLKVDF